MYEWDLWWSLLRIKKRVRSNENITHQTKKKMKDIKNRIQYEMQKSNNTGLRYCQVELMFGGTVVPGKETEEKSIKTIYIAETFVRVLYGCV